MKRRGDVILSGVILHNRIFSYVGHCGEWHFKRAQRKQKAIKWSGSYQTWECFGQNLITQVVSQAIPSATPLCYVPPSLESYKYGSESPLAFKIVLAGKCLIKWNPIYKPLSNEVSPSSHSGADDVHCPPRGSIWTHVMAKYIKCVLTLLSNDLVQDPDPSLTYVTLKINVPLWALIQDPVSMRQELGNTEPTEVICWKKRLHECQPYVILHVSTLRVTMWTHLPWSGSNCLSTQLQR